MIVKTFKYIKTPTGYRREEVVEDVDPTGYTWHDIPELPNVDVGTKVEDEKHDA